jgi:hypothetical protein
MKLTHCALLAVVLSGSTIHAEETVHWDDLAKIVKESKPRGSHEYTIVTTTGEKIRSRQLWASAAGLQIPPFRKLGPDQVLEIQVRHRGRLSYFGWLTDQLCPEPFSCLIPPTFLVILPADLAFGAVTTPLMLPIEGSRRRKAPRILKIVP